VFGDWGLDGLGECGRDIFVVVVAGGGAVVAGGWRGGGLSVDWWDCGAERGGGAAGLVLVVGPSLARWDVWSGQVRGMLERGWT
jgi:hypothetical protein